MIVRTQKSHLISNFLESISDSDEEVLEALESFIEVYKNRHKSIIIPLKLFSNRKLGVLEVSVKYLIEHYKFKYHQAALILNRNDRTIWSSYKKASTKDQTTYAQTDDQTNKSGSYQESFASSDNKASTDITKINPSDLNNLMIDARIFSDRKQSPLGSLVVYLKDKKSLSYNQISEILKRDYRTIWLTYKKSSKPTRVSNG